MASSFFTAIHPFNQQVEFRETRSPNVSGQHANNLRFSLNCNKNPAKT
jgi:hypothetical protein